ncbi:MAG: hypothetical protein EON93_23835 [Burkholderiales bacterium]|nr:MAG: hypothetical protein EON93_23835 [Burkholderiales bacterium]
MADGDELLGSAVGTENLIFGFELDFAGKLQCMPMIARLKLDRCGVKLSLKQWNRMTLVERQALVQMPCDTVEEIDAYADRVSRLIVDSGDSVSRFQIDLEPAWERSDGPPAHVTDFAINAGVRPPTADEWATLSPLQRFVVLKLTRPGHTNANLGPALREFGLSA